MICEQHLNHIHANIYTHQKKSVLQGKQIAIDNNGKFIALIKCTSKSKLISKLLVFFTCSLCLSLFIEYLICRGMCLAMGEIERYTCAKKVASDYYGFLFPAPPFVQLSYPNTSLLHPPFPSHPVQSWSRIFFSISYYSGLLLSPSLLLCL